MMYAVRPNFLLRSLYPSALWRIPAPKKKLFLTFDDGPIPEVTPWVLSLLKEYKAKATLFCVGANIEKHPEIFRQLISEGYSIGNHTYNHLNGWKTRTREYLENVEQCKSVINSEFRIHNLELKLLFRPPYGKMKRAQFSILNSQFSIIMWDVLS